jgi:2'-5' RNA ligase
VRLFVSVPLPDLQRADLQRALIGGRTTNPDQWHLTLAFLGDRDDELEIVDALATVAREHTAFTLQIAGSGHFPGVEWAGIGGDLPALSALAADVARACRVQQAFRPHVTIARRGRVQLGKDYSGPRWTVASFDLVQSTLGAHAEHQLLERFPLT